VRLNKIICTTVLLSTTSTFVVNAQYPNPPANFQQLATGPTLSDADDEESTAKDRITQFLNIGPVRIRPRASYNIQYDDNIYLREKDTTKDLIHTISPAIAIFSDAIRVGPKGIGLRREKQSSGEAESGAIYFGIDYMPSFIYFTENSNNDTIDHRFGLKIGKNFERLTLDLNHTLEKTSDAAIEEGGRTSRLNNSSSLNLTYRMTGKTSWDGRFAYQTTEYKSFTGSDTTDYSTLNWFNYIFSKKMDFGPGFTVGQSEIVSSPGSLYEQVQLRLRYSPTRKLGFTVNGGLEFRQFEGGQKIVSPIFGLGLAYLPTPRSSIAIAGSKQLRPSNLFPDEITDVTSFQISASQRVWQRVDFGIGVGYVTSDYSSTRSSSAGNSGYSQVFLSPSITYNLKKYWSFSLLGNYRKADATRFESFTNTRIGLTAAFRF